MIKGFEKYIDIELWQLKAKGELAKNNTGKIKLLSDLECEAILEGDYNPIWTHLHKEVKESIKFNLLIDKFDKLIEALNAKTT